MTGVSSSFGEFICSACLHDQGSFAIERPRHVLVRCSRCGLAHTLPRPTAADDSHQLDDLGDYDAVMSRLRPGFEFHADRLLRLLNEYAPPPRKLLEIGCATGLLLKAAKKAGYSVSGLEPASGHSDFLPPEVAASVQRRKLEDADFAEASFDVIVAIQLLEHLIDPAVFALKLRHILKPGGIAYVETPNFDCVSRRLKLDSWMDKNLIAGHWHLFDPHSISVFCERMGLRVLRCWTFFKALGIHSRSAVLGKSLLSLDYTLGRAGLGNNVAVLITRD